METTITKPAVGIGRNLTPLVDGFAFTVGQSVAFSAELAGDGTLTVSGYGKSVRTRPLASPGQLWTVTDKEIGVDTLILEHRNHKKQISKITVKVTVAKAAGSPPPAKDTDSPAQSSDTSSPATGKLTGKMRIGLVDASAQALAITRPLLEPLKLFSVAPWIDTGNFKSFVRDPDVTKVIELAAALGLSPLWRCAQGILDSKTAIRDGVAWHVSHAADTIAAMDANPATRNKPVRIQIGNEPDNGEEYYIGGEASYVRDYLAPVATELRQRFQKRLFIVAAGWSWNIGTLEPLADQIAPVVDAFAFHGYPVDVTKDAFDPIRRAVALAHSRGKQLIRSEGNTGDGKAYKKLADKDKPAALVKWAAKIGPALVMSEECGVDEELYFIAYDHLTTASPAHLFDLVKRAGKVQSLATTPFYHAMRSVVA